MFNESEEKKERGYFAIGSNARETPINETTQEDINYLMDRGHEVDNDRLPYPKNKPKLYKEGWKWSGI